MSHNYTSNTELKDYRSTPGSENTVDPHKTTTEGPAIDDTEVNNIRTSWKSIFTYTTKPHFAIFAIAWILTILSGITKPTISIFLGLIFDEVTSFGAGTYTKSQLLKGVSTWCIALSALGLAAWIINGGFFTLWLVFGELQAKEARTQLFVGLLERNMEWYDLRKDGIPSLLTRAQTQIRELQIATSQPLGFLLEDAAATLAALGIAFIYSWKLTLVVLAIVPALVIILSLIAKRLQPAIEAQKRQLTNASKSAHTAISQVDTVKIFNAQGQEAQQYTTYIKAAARSYLIQANFNALQMGVTRFVTVAMFVAGFWYGLVLINQGLSAGNVLTTFYACMMATQGAEALLPQFLVLAKGMSAGGTLRDIVLLMEGGRKVTKMVGSRKPDVCYGDVEVSNVTFSYPSNPDRLVLNNVSFFFPAGETTFVVGRSGSGKSTFSNLILKYYKPSSGSISIDGEAIQTLDLDWIRNNIFLLQQQSILFNETMFRNIAFGRRKHTMVTKDDIKLACQTALLEETIHNLPEGLDTMLGLGGNSMSGGQRQRIAIARARLRDAPILVLDEATSALDIITKRLVMDAIREWRRRKTTIIITHDISQVLDDDYVYVLDQGKIVEEGYRNRLVADPFGLFTSFLPMSTSLGDDSSGRSALTRSSSQESLDSTVGPLEGSADLIAGSRRLSHVNRISKFLGIDDEAAPRSYLQNRRTSLGLATAHATGLIAENIWKAPQVPPGAYLKTPNLMKPLPSLPLDGYSPEGQQKVLPDAEPLALMQLMGRTTLHSRSGINKLSRSRKSTLVRVAGGHDDDTINLLGRKPARKRKNEQKNKQGTQTQVTLRKVLATVWPALKSRDRLVLVVAFFSAFVNAASMPAFSYVFAQLLSTFYLPSGQAEEARKWAIATLAIAIIDATSSYLFHYCLEYCGQAWIDNLRIEALARILAQPRSWFDKEKNAPERLNECLDRNAEEMRNLVGRFAGYVFVAASMMSIAIVWAFVLCWKLTLVGLASAPVMYAFTRAYETVNAKWEKKSDEQSEYVSRVFTETFSNIRVVRALLLEDYFKNKQAVATLNAYNIGIRRAAYSGFFFGLSDSTNFFVTALVLYYGAVVASSGQWPVASVLAVITLLLFSSANANAMMAFIPQINNSKLTAARMLYLANLPRRASHEAQGTKRLLTPFPISLNSLSFSYPSSPSVEILHRISVSFPARSCTAIVGSSGSGKSTIASLLLGLYPPNDSHEPSSSPPLSYAGTSILDCHMPTLRNIITIVSQSPIIFPTTIAGNITYGLSPSSPFRSVENLEDAAREAGIHDFIISLPRGYGTVIGEGGQGLSGGQAQRISIARALIRRPKVLILDEATSALDVESAKTVRDTIVKLKEGRDRAAGMAIIIITHGIEMMKIAERIVMLDYGRVVEQGAFEELARGKGPFAKLIRGGE